MERNIILVTGNEHKLNEWQRQMPPSFKLTSVDLDIPEIQSLDIDEVVKNKVKLAYEKLGKPVVVDDISAGLEELEWLPGTFIKFFIKKLGADALYKLSKKPNPKAKIICAVAYYDGKRLLVVKGEIMATVTTPKGSNGFGFDQSSIPDGYTKTFAEMSDEEKDQSSHRSKAIKAFLKEL